MMPKMSVSPMPRRAYVPPSISALTTCWSSWSKMKSGARSPGSIRFHCEEWPLPRRSNPGASGKPLSVRHGIAASRIGAPRDDPCALAHKAHLAPVDLHDVHRRNALSAFLARGTGLGERDLAVHADELGLPQRLPDRFAVGPAGF